MPDKMRDALEEQLRTAIRNAPEESRASVESDAYGKISAEVVGKFLFPSPEESRADTFVRQFQEAWLAMHGGSGNPAIVIENLPPTQGRFVTLGLAGLEGEICFHEKYTRYTQDQSAAGPHRDTYDARVRSDKKPGQFLYCADAGPNPQPTLFITPDEVIDHMARQVKDKSFAQAHQEIVEKLEQIHINSGGEAKPFLTRNPNYDPNGHSDAPQFIAYTTDRTLRHDQRKNRIIDPSNSKMHVAFIFAADEVADAQQAAVFAPGGEVGIASMKSPSLVLWNDMLTFHMRGQTRNGKDSSERLVEAVESDRYFDRRCESVPTAAPCSQIEANHPIHHQGQIDSAGLPKLHTESSRR